MQGQMPQGTHDSPPPLTGAWELPEELELLRRSVAEFVAREVRPREDGLDFDAISLGDEDLRALQEKARSAGLWCLASPVEHGGGGLGALALAVVAEEAAQCRLGAYVPAGGAFGWDPPVVIFEGTRQQVERYAVPQIRGDGGKAFVAISEPSGGSDPARSIRTRAVRDGDGWVLDGTKTWISGALQATWGIVYARTGAPGDRRGISCFVVDANTPGLTMRPIPVIRAWYPAELSFQACRLPASSLIGREGDGFALADLWLTRQRIPYAAGTIGVARAALRLAIDHARERHAFGGPLADKQAVQWMIADSEIELRAARLLVYQAAWRADLGRDFKVDASIAKVYATEAAGRVVDRCIQVLGGMGVARELPLERWYRELRVKRIGEGPSEVHRMVVARSLLGRRR